MTSDRSPTGLEARVRDALQAAAATVTAASRPSTAEQLAQRASPPHWRWPVIALAAAVAVCLAVAVAVGLLHGSSSKPLPAPSPTSELVMVTVDGGEPADPELGAVLAGRFCDIRATRGHGGVSPLL